MIKRALIVLGATVIAGCDPGDFAWIGIPDRIKCQTFEVKELRDCTEATSNAWSGTFNGACRGIMTDGTRITVMRPITAGDQIKACKRAHEPTWRQQR